MTPTEQATRSSEPLSDSLTSTVSPVFDLLCIGFGASQLATAIANREARTPHKVLFLEQKLLFSWHSGPHLSRTRMENAFMYDLATLRNPRSSFTYVNYLLARGRLIEFANSDRLNPLREEFEDYLRWCADKFKDEVRYGSEVIGVVPDTESKVVKGWKITVRESGDNTYTVRARNIIAPYPSKPNPSLPQPISSVDFLAGQRIISMRDYASRRNELRGANEPRLNIFVVGGGQQTAEILDDLLSCPRLGNITILTEDDLFAPLTVLDNEVPPQPQLCSIWAKPAAKKETDVTNASELLQKIYMHAYEKQVQTKGVYRLHVVIGTDDDGSSCSQSNFIIRDSAATPTKRSELLQEVDPLVLGCQQKGDSLNEVQFKRGVVASGCRLWLLSNPEGKRSLAKDVSTMAGEIVKNVSLAADAVVTQTARL